VGQLVHLDSYRVSRDAQRGGVLTVVNGWLLAIGVFAFGAWFLWFVGVR
jgi:hypothetical protein